MGFKKEKMGWVFGCLLGIFFCSSLILSVGIPDMYNSPDERAAATAISSFVSHRHFAVDEMVNLDLIVPLHPRSMVAVGAQLVPVTFPGLLLVYGGLGKVISFPLTKLLTPLLAVFAVLAWRRILETFLPKRTSLVASILFMTLAGFWFYTARVFMHNVPFLAFFVFGIWALVCRPLASKQEKEQTPLQMWDAALAGLFFGVALLFRTSELIWMALAGVVFLWAFRSVFRWKTILPFLVFLGIGVSPLFVWNEVQFQNPWQLGYTFEEVVSSPAPALSLEESINPSRLWGEVVEVVFPFGVHPRLALRRFAEYQIGLTWWMTILSVLGLFLMWRSREVNTKSRRLLRTIIVATAVAGGYLTLFYGSWNIVDNPDPNAVTLANSYVRYWLPIYLASTIPSALAIEWLASRTSSLNLRRGVETLLLSAVLLLSARLVFFHPEDGLVRTRQVLQESVAIREQVMALTEAESVIVVDRADKILFPARRVLFPLRSEETYDALPRLVSQLPTYYYGITLPEEDLRHLNEDILAPRGLVAESVQPIGIETLYRFSLL